MHLITINILTDIKLCKAQSSGGFRGSSLCKIAGPLMKVAVPLAKESQFL